MMGIVRSTGNIMRKAGETTVILQVLSAVLLVVLVFLFLDISRQFRILHDDIRDDAVWSIFQLDREVRALAVSPAVPGASSSGNEFEEQAARWNAVRQHVSAVGEARLSADFLAEATAGRLLADISVAMADLDRFFEGGVSAANQEELGQALAILSDKTEELLAYTHAQRSAERAYSRALILDLERTAAIMLALLMASVVFLVVTLRRQLKSVRKAGLELEGMTHRLTGAYEAADAGNRAKSQFMATMGHEIRTPLNAILGMAELLEYSELPDDARSSVKTIRSSGEALLEVINEILDYSKIEHGKLELEERAVDVHALAETTVSIIRGRADDHGNTIVLDIPDSLDALYVRTDPTRLRQVLLNLLSNAVKFTSKGTVTLRMREFYRGGKLMLRFEVEDTGIGIDETGLAKLFQPFSQVDASISRKYGGTGLGLTICKQIVEKLGGELGMSSTVGVGSIFWFELAVVAVGKDEVKNQSGTSDVSASLPRMRILLVEDNRVNQMVATRFLNRLGQDVTIANDGAEAVQSAAEEVFDLILMDMQMPVMDGIEAGMTGFESKPVTMKRLRKVIATFSETAADEVADPQEAAGLPDLEEFDVPTLPPLPFDGLDEARHSELVDALGEDVFRELVESFFNDADGLIDELMHAVGEENAAEIDRVLHTIKGAAINVGLSDLAGKANALRDQETTITDVEILTDEIETLKFKLVA
ncbi:MAG: ATP-binding protein [Rhizobium sp.]